MNDKKCYNLEICIIHVQTNTVGGKQHWISQGDNSHTDHLLTLFDHISKTLSLGVWFGAVSMMSGIWDRVYHNAISWNSP